MNLLIVALDGVIPADVRDAEVLVVAPALNSWLRHWLSDDDPRAAGRRSGPPCSSTGSNGMEPALGGVSATPIRCRRSRMRCRPFRPTGS